MKKQLFHLLLSLEGLRQSAAFRASAKYGAVITDMKGSIGGTTFKGTAQAAVVQNKITSAPQGKSGGKITKADAGRVINTQRNQTLNVQAWKGLSDSDRATWTAGAVNFPFVNKFGESYTPSGYQLYISVNNNLLAIGESPVSVCPAPGPIEDTPAFTVNYDSGTGQIRVSGSNVSGYSQVLYACVNQSPGKTLDWGRMKAIAILPDSQTYPYNASPAYSALFGTVPTSGNIWLAMKITKADAGRQGSPYVAQLQY